MAIRDVARLMTEAVSTVASVRMNSAFGIVTDDELRERVVGGDVATDDPVSAVAVDPAPTVRADQLAVEAMIDLLERDLDHIVVLDGPKVLGTVSAHELVGLEGRSPLTLRRALLRARDEDELVQACARLPKVFLALMDADLAPPDVGRVLALAEDAATLRLIDFSIERNGPAPVAWAWLALGSAARRELTLCSDQDNALAYADSEDPESADAYFEGLATEVTAGLVRCGWKIDPNSVLGANPAERAFTPGARESRSRRLSTHSSQPKRSARSKRKPRRACARHSRSPRTFASTTTLRASRPERTATTSSIRRSCLRSPGA